MKKLYIVKKKQDFNDIIKKGKSIKNKEFVIYYRKNGLPYDRFGISVGIKLGNAVFRNKYKRKIRSIVDQCTIDHSYEYDFIILLRKNGTIITFNELNISFNKLMSKLGK